MVELFPGCIIFAGPGQGSLTCFVTRNDGHLYALTAAHCVKGVGDLIHYNTQVNRKFLGTVKAVTDGAYTEWDAALISVNDTLARTVDSNNLHSSVKGFLTPFKTAPGPDDIRGTDKTIQVYHAGFKSEIVGGIDYGAQPGLVDLGNPVGRTLASGARFTLTNRITRAGDSGGPIFTANAQLIGILGNKLGNDGPDNEATKTRFTLVSAVLTYFHAELATMENKATWCPNALPIVEDDDDSDADPFEGKTFTTSKLYTLARK